jgi:hypothetical protein
MITFNAARALVDIAGGPRPGANGYAASRDQAILFSQAAFGGEESTPEARIEEVRDSGVQAGWWRDPTFQKGAIIAGIALLIIYFQARNDPQD